MQCYIITHVQKPRKLCCRLEGARDWGVHVEGGAKTSNIENICFRIKNNESSEIKLLKRALNLNTGAKKEVAWGEVVPEEI